MSSNHEADLKDRLGEIAHHKQLLHDAELQHALTEQVR